LSALRDAGRGSAAGSTRLRLRHAFVSFQVALAVVLSIGAGLIVRSAWSLGRTDPGFPVENLLTFRVPFPFGEVQAAGATGSTATIFYNELTRRLEALPGVEAAGWGSCAPLSSLCDSGGFALRRAEDEQDSEAPAVSVRPGLSRLPGGARHPPARGTGSHGGRSPWAHEPGSGEREPRATAVAPARTRSSGRSPRSLRRGHRPITVHVAGVVTDVRFDNLRGTAAHWSTSRC